MKKNILAVLIASTFIVACSGSSDAPSTSIKAYDGPVMNADVSYNCDTATGTVSGNAGQTDYYGAVNTTNVLINNTPEVCEITATGNADSIDTSNGKPMPNIEYVIPRGLLEVGDSISLSPLTTLIAKQIEADALAGTPRNIDEVVTQVVTDLYGDTFINDTGVTALEMALDMEGTITKLKTNDPTAASKVIATNNVTNDVLVYSQKTATLSITQILETSKTVAAKVVADNPVYPSIATDSTKVTYVTVDVAVAVTNPDADVDVLVDKTDVPIEDLPQPPATGATGGS